MVKVEKKARDEEGGKSENDLVTYYEMKTNKRLIIKHKHTEFKLSLVIYPRLDKFFKDL